MIKKDISCPYVEPQRNESANSPTQSVDDIFANADAIMEAQRCSNGAVVEKKRSRKFKFIRFILSFVLIAVLLIGGLVALIIYSFKETYPQIKSNILEQVNELREDLLASDDSQLNIDEYYQKQIILLLTDEDFQVALNEFEDIDKILDLLSSGGIDDLSFLSEEKLAEYNRLIEDYEQAKIAETTEQSDKNIETFDARVD